MENNWGKQYMKSVMEEPYNQLWFCRNGSSAADLGRKAHFKEVFDLDVKILPTMLYRIEKEDDVFLSSVNVRVGKTSQNIELLTWFDHSRTKLRW